MKTLKTLIAILGLSALALAQTNTLTTTTLSSAVANGTVSAVQVASATGISGVTASNPGSFLYIDRELMQVISVSGTTINVFRGQGGTAATPHLTGMLVWIGNGDWFSNGSVGSVPQGTCTASSQYYYPHIHVLDGSMFTCSAEGRWGYAGPSGFHYGLPNSRTAVTTTYTAKYYDNIIEADPTGGGFTLTLPSAAALPGKVFFIVNPGSSTNTITVTTATGCATIAAANGTCRVYSTGSVWHTF